MRTIKIKFKATPEQLEQLKTDAKPVSAQQKFSGVHCKYGTVINISIQKSSIIFTVEMTDDQTALLKKDIMTGPSFYGEVYCKYGKVFEIRN